MSNQHIRLSEALTGFLATRKARLAPASWENERAVLGRFVQEIGDLQVRNLRPEHVEAWFAHLLEEHTNRLRMVHPPVKPSTYNFLRARVLSLHRYCVSRGYTRVGWLDHVGPMKVHRRQRVQADARTLLRLLDHPQHPRDRAIVAVAINTGLRVGEIQRLRVGDVNLAKGELHVVITKSGVEDLMPVTSDLDRELRRWLTTYAQAIERGLIAEDYLFPSHMPRLYRWRTLPDGTRERYQPLPEMAPHRPTTRATAVVKAALESVGLDARGEGVHTVRRSVARVYFDHLVADGGYDHALRSTSALLHHANSAVTEVYLGLSSERRTRDAFLRGRSLFDQVDETNVVPIRAAHA